MHFLTYHNPLIVLTLVIFQKNVDIINIRKELEKKEIFYNITKHSIFQHGILDRFLV
jgi:predicted DNA-binding transcriptional regulator